MTGNSGSREVEPTTAYTFSRSALGSSNFTFGVGGLFLQSGIYRSTITINYKNGTGVTPYTSSNSNITDPLFFVPIKFDIKYAAKDDCVRDTVNHASRYTDAIVTDPRTEEVWEHRNINYKWSTNKNLSGWTWTGEYEDR